ncbi:MAG: hypothetical protein NTV57_12380 [Cyanobacteria bacterium]|nr:hypothetical protein [Cyanobacteriota bacterium]
MGPILRLLPLGLLALLTACGPVYQAWAAPRPVPIGSAEPDPRRLLGTWALTDNDNLLFNLLLRPDGSALSATGSQGPRPLAAGTMTAGELMELGHWKGWGNGVRIDYDDGWTDTILVAPGGPIQWSWAPGRNRDEPPTNTGKAVRLSGVEAGWVGVYRFAPSQADQPPYLASLLSSGRAINSIDMIAAGSWRQEAGHLVIDWASGWRSTIAQPTPPAPGQSFVVRHWAPGADRQGPASRQRQGERL